MDDCSIAYFVVHCNKFVQRTINLPQLTFRTERRRRDGAVAGPSPVGWVLIER
ncbi:hypothetical protein FB004_10965 [Sinorhizobium medicae]|nr:hypothetical protein FB004_10965 [Sinorhizobium medicae]